MLALCVQACVLGCLKKNLIDIHGSTQLSLSAKPSTWCHDASVESDLAASSGATFQQKLALWVWADGFLWDLEGYTTLLQLHLCALCLEKRWLGSEAALVPLSRQSLLMEGEQLGCGRASGEQTSSGQRSNCSLQRRV